MQIGSPTQSPGTHVTLKIHFVPALALTHCESADEPEHGCVVTTSQWPAVVLQVQSNPTVQDDVEFAQRPPHCESV